MRSLIMIAAAAAALGALRPATARADALNFSVCNAYGGTIFLALGWKDAAGWHSRGWWSIDEGKCSLQPISAPNLYYFWESAAQTNCICPPPVSNGQENGGVMLAKTEDAFRLDNASQAFGDASLGWFNPTLLTAAGGIPADFVGLDKLIIGTGGSGKENLYIHQPTALMPLP